MTGSVRIALATVAVLAALLGAASPESTQGRENGTALASAHRPPAGSEKSRVTPPGGTDGVALDLGYVEEPESPIPPVLSSMTSRDSQAIGVASVLLVGGMLLLVGGATFMIVTLARVSRRERHIERILLRRDVDRDA